MVWCGRQRYIIAPRVPLATLSTELKNCAISTWVEMGLLDITQCPSTYSLSDFDSSKMRCTACLGSSG
ncbi:hypothetical protein L210DRAFT_3557630, partial [Boletus edulis BED1]